MSTLEQYVTSYHLDIHLHDYNIHITWAGHTQLLQKATIHAVTCPTSHLLQGSQRRTASMSHDPFKNVVLFLMLS